MRSARAADGSIGNGSQTGFILPLHFDMLPAELRRTAADRLAADIVRRGKLLSTGFLGTPHSRSGDYAFAVRGADYASE